MSIVQHFTEIFTDVFGQYQYMIISLEMKKVSVGGVAPVFSTGDVSYTKSNALILRFSEAHLHL